MVVEQKVEQTKTKEEILAERKAKKAAKKQGKNKAVEGESSKPEVKPVEEVKPKVEDVKLKVEEKTEGDKSREAVLKEREMKKLAKQAAKQKKDTSKKETPLATPEVSPEAAPKIEISPTYSTTSTVELVEPAPIIKTPSTASTITGQDSDFARHISDLIKTDTESSPEIVQKKPATTKAERRAIQEAQRAKKEAAQKAAAAAKLPPKPAAKTEAPRKCVTSKPKSDTAKETKSVPAPSLHRVKLFNHLYHTDKRDGNVPVNSKVIHPAIIRLGAQYASGIIVGGNARCVAFLKAVKELIRDYETPEQKDFGRGLESLLAPSMDYLKECRPPSESMINALKHIKWQINTLKPEDSDATKKIILIESIDTYIRDQIEKAAQAISNFVQEKITDGDVLLTYGRSSLVKHILMMANERQVKFRVIVVDALPRREGQEMLKCLARAGIQCTCVLISAVSFVMPVVTKVLLGAHALLGNGYVMSRVGTAQIALMSKSFNVPVLVCCETHKFSERVQTDAFVYNEIDDPEKLVYPVTDGCKDPLANWENIPHLTPLNLTYDFTPPELVTAVVTEIGILPCTSAPVILRMKPSEVGY